MMQLYGVRIGLGVGKINIMRVEYALRSAAPTLCWTHMQGVREQEGASEFAWYIICNGQYH